MLPLFLLAFFLTAWSQDTSIETVDKEIETLTRQLRESRKDEFNEEIEGQELMRSGWSDYAKKLSRAESEEHEAEQIEKRLLELRTKKAELSKEKSPP